MKVIFLDIDGVLCNRACFKLPRRVHACDPDCSHYQAWPECVQLLNSIIAATGAKIVVSSTWRLMGHAKIARILKDWGVVAEVCGITPRMNGLMNRGDEIGDWLSNRNDIESFVILDDDCDMGNLKDKLVWTHHDAGLTLPDAEKAIAILGVKS
jgi:hypothetical protein